MRITKVYTKTGDGGETGLGGGQRIPKDHLRIESYGTVDELNSALGVARLHVADPALASTLVRIQHQLFDLGSDLAVLAPDKKRFGMPLFPGVAVTWLEEQIDAATSELPPLEEFVLPAGEPGAAHLHLARCICRRAERLVVGLAREEEVSEHVVPYLNRLSDALFCFARLVNLREGTGDVLWVKGAAAGGPLTPAEEPGGDES
ncbi:MAG: cob(I)yrinic acid a,c-diamide adenosyltransferase [Planctomycetes bacterium]|nr:cob(I)yrinic acid a,c-diamide adenosyltransferase [Planctomycetota bacterium]